MNVDKILGRLTSLLLVITTALAPATTASAQIEPAPDRSEGEGPFQRMVLRGATMIDGTGAPPIGPVDIVVENDRIVQISVVGNPGAEIDPDSRPAAGDFEMDLAGQYIMPGFVDLHGHIGGTAQGTPAEYVYKLWMGHGITTIRDPGSGNGLEWTLSEAARSERNEITAPRIITYRVFGSEWEQPPSTPDEAREWVREMTGKGMQGIKFFGAAPEILKAALNEAGKLGIGTTMHHAQMHVTRMNALQTAGWGLNSTTTTRTSRIDSLRPASSGNRPRPRTARSGTK